MGNDVRWWKDRDEWMPDLGDAAPPRLDSGEEGVPPVEDAGEIADDDSGDFDDDDFGPRGPQLKAPHD